MKKIIGFANRIHLPKKVKQMPKFSTEKTLIPLNLLLSLLTCFDTEKNSNDERFLMKKLDKKLYTKTLYKNYDKKTKVFLLEVFV